MFFVVETATHVSEKEARQVLREFLQGNNSRNMKR